MKRERKQAQHGTPSAAEKTRSAEWSAGRTPTSREAAARERRAVGTFPTPLANDAQKRGNFDIHNPRNGLAGAARRDYPTPIRNDSHGGSDAAGRQGSASLKQTVRRAIRDQPTPTAQNGLRDGAGSEHRPLMYGSPGDEGYGELNPAWEEWLMGWPIGWTSLEPMDPALYASWRDGIVRGGAGDSSWWWADPSEDANPACGPDPVPKVTRKDLPARVERVAAIGNGQVSAAAAAAFLLLDSIEFPEGEQP